MFQLQEREIYFDGTTPGRRNLFEIEVRYNDYGSFLGYFFLSPPVRKAVRAIQKSGNRGTLVLLSHKDKWFLSFIEEQGKNIPIGYLSESAFATLEQKWLDLSSRNMPIKDEALVQWNNNTVLWIRYHGMTFYKKSDEQFRDLLLGLITGAVICPEDKAMECVFAHPAQYRFSRNGYDWDQCPDDIRRLTAPRQCAFSPVTV